LGIGDWRSGISETLEEGIDLAQSTTMPKILSFRDLIAWQKAMDLADMVYDLTEHFPPREMFGLAYQLRKSAVSIPSNIAEGSRRKTAGYVHHLIIALGSHAELDTQCEIASRRCFITADDRKRVEALIAEVGRVTHGLVRSLDPNPLAI
jgi:four helix bundle protein